VVTVSCIILTTVNTVRSVTTFQVAFRVIILHTCLVRISEEGVLEERPANAATSGSHVGWHNGNALVLLACNNGI